MKSFVLLVFLAMQSFAASPKVVKKVAPQPAKKAVVQRAPAQQTRPVFNDPSKAVEVRGQARTLSMMLVLKNGRENINFIKVRKDYSTEIAATQF